MEKYINHIKYKGENADSSGKKTRLPSGSFFIGRDFSILRH